MKTRTLLPLCQAVLLATAVLAAPGFAATAEKAPAQHANSPKPAAKPAIAKKTTAAKKVGKHGDKHKTVAAKDAKPQTPGPMADFGQANPSADVKQVANWVSYSRNAQKRAFVIVDKKAAQVYVFDPKGKLVAGSSPVLLGLAKGDNL